MSRVVVSGLGIVSCLGCDAATVTESLRQGRSGIKFIREFAEQGLRSQVGGRPDIDLESRIEISNPRTGLVAGSGGGSMANQIAAVDKASSGQGIPYSLRVDHRHLRHCPVAPPADTATQ